MTAEPRNLLAPVRHWARVAEDRVFLEFRDLDGSVASSTYGRFHDRVRRLAAGLASEGLRAGDRCVVHTGNTAGFLEALFAVLEAGAVAVPTIAQYSAAELRYVVRHSEAWGVVTSEPLLGTVREAVDGTSCRVLVEGSALDALAAAGDPGTARGGAAPGETALILYTSGTTSRPKGVMLGSAGSLFTALSYAHQLRLRPDDVTLTCMPLFHVNGMFLQLMPTVVSGARFVLTPRFSASRYWSWVIEHDVTFAHLVAGPIRLLLAAEPGPRDRDHRVRGMTFGLPLSDREIRDFESRFGIPPAMVWGLTETCCGATLMPIGFGARPGHQNIGPAMLGWDVRAVDADLRELPDGEVGELVVRSPGVMLGYHRDPEATAATLRDGWVRTGDLGYRDDDGYFHFVDRMKDMLKPSGENVAASEIEDVINAHPAVSECAVVGVPDLVRSEKVVALVVPVAGASITPGEVQAHCRERLAGFKVPSVVEMRAELPKTSIGKVRKGELRDELLRGSCVVTGSGRRAGDRRWLEALVTRDPYQVCGTVADDFERVQEVFAEHVTEVGDGGAAFAAVVEGRLVADLWAGRAGEVAWGRDTRGVLMSATKGVATVAVGRLVDRGLLDVEAPVARYWPEFAAGGKGDVTVGAMLSHSAGLVSVPGYERILGADGAGWDDTAEVLARLASAVPLWPPGSAHAYHPITFGWLVAELVRRVSGTTVGALVREEIATSVGGGLDLGTPAAIQGSVAPVILPGPVPSALAGMEGRLGDPTSAFSRAVLAVNGRSPVVNTADVFFSNPAILALELPAINATGTARALALTYGALADVDRSAPLLTRETIRELAAERVRGPNRITGLEERFGVGFMLPVPPPPGLPPWSGPHDEAFGHPGFGGQFGFADPVRGVGVGMVRSHLSWTSALGARLVDAVYECVEGSDR